MTLLASARRCQSRDVDFEAVHRTVRRLWGPGFTPGKDCVVRSLEAFAVTRPPFTHLHVHTQYSLLDGAARLGDMFNAYKEVVRMPSSVGRRRRG